jgi:hypothetical protein
MLEYRRGTTPTFNPLVDGSIPSRPKSHPRYAATYPSHRERVDFHRMRGSEDSGAVAEIPRVHSLVSLNRPR